MATKINFEVHDEVLHPVHGTGVVIEVSATFIVVRFTDVKKSATIFRKRGSRIQDLTFVKHNSTLLK